MPCTPTLEVELTPGVWTDKSADLIAEPIRWNRGIFGSGPLDRLARPGTLSFALDNTAQNAAGTADYYSPGHANAVAGWRHGTRVRLKLENGGPGPIVSWYVFRGRIKDILPDPPVTGLRVVRCVAQDWIADFADLDAVELVLRENVTADALLDDLVALANEPPASTDFDTGLDTYPFAFDDLGGSVPKATQVSQDILQSELGYLYLRGDGTDGETLRFENRHARAGAEPILTLTEADLENARDVLEAPSTLDHIFNDIETMTVPRRVDAAATSVLVRLDAPIEVAPGATETEFVDYLDPDNEAVFIGGKAMVQPAATTDWTANTAEDGSGSDVTADVSIAATYFGSRAMIAITNNGTVSAFVRGPGGADGLQARGRGLFRYRAVSSRGIDQDSIDDHDRRPLPSPLLMPYQNDRNIGQGLAQFLAHVYGSGVNLPSKVKPLTHADHQLEREAITLDVGDRIAVPVAGESVDVYIHALECELSLAGYLRVAWTIAPADTTDVLILDDLVAGTLDDHVLGYG
jgi:hypothetical protein